MVKNTFKNESQSTKKENNLLLFVKDKRIQLSLGVFLVFSSFYLLISLISYIFTGKIDQSVVESIGKIGVIESSNEVKNWLGLYGAVVSHQFIFLWFGIASFFIPPILLVLGYKLLIKKSSWINSVITFCVFFTIWFSVFLGYVVHGTEEITDWSFLCGGIGYHLAIIFEGLIGWGTLLILLFFLIVFIIFFLDIKSLFKPKSLQYSSSNNEVLYKTKKNKGNNDLNKEIESSKSKVFDADLILKDSDKKNFEIELSITPSQLTNNESSESQNKDLEINHNKTKEKIVSKQDNYDPRLDLSSYKYPTIELLDNHNISDGKVTKQELEQNKDKIIETLVNFKIGISSIKATIGPTVTLYEIVPDAGIKISKIKNLEDDIALSLSALGIRIIAPIPGKGTIGIEVPNKFSEMVGIRSVLSTERFMKSDKELPVVLGKTISNEVFMIDLAKMPHLLMAGATGQGKSVGLNVLLTSLLYKKHPSQLKLVLVDPKKVELTLFNKIEKHFLAMLPDGEEAIITDTKKVIHTLNSLCIEMDNRYDLLKKAGCRNLKEYNLKFVKRRLNPKEGHRFIPYVVLIIDELADLMMTAGKEVETPIARLAQLARAIGIHLVIATQRPSVNVITGIIKANFPARLSFRVTSKIDSRTILDTGGADQLIGMGDMLFSQGSELTRIQCAFVDTNEVERICEYIGNQNGYESAYMLPEFVADDDGKNKELDLSDRDVLFEEAARLVVIHQQGSTSLIQRKLKLGYNRAGRLIDQLEAAGIVGQFGGSKAREVLIPDEYSLEQLLSEINN